MKEYQMGDVQGHAMRCESCDIEVTDHPVTARGHIYCCTGCADGGPCVCSYENQQVIFPTNGHGDPALTQEFLRKSGDWQESV
jgi:hypothetical protein